MATERSFKVMLTGVFTLTILLIFWVFFPVSAPRLGISPQDIVEHPDAWLGKKVVLSGEIDDEYGFHAFTIGGSDFGGHELLVVSPRMLVMVHARAVERPFWKKDLVQVVGKIKKFDVNSMEREIDVDLNERELAQWNGKPVLVASEVVLSPRKVLEPDLLVMVVDMSKQPERFMTRSVRTDGYVKKVLGPYGFILSEEPQGIAEVVVVGAGPAVLPQLKRGDKVKVTGVGQIFSIHEVEKQLKVDLDEGLFGNLDKKAGIFARKVEKF